MLYSPYRIGKPALIFQDEANNLGNPDGSNGQVVLLESEGNESNQRGYYAGDEDSSHDSYREGKPQSPYDAPV